MKTKFYKKKYQCYSKSKPCVILCTIYIHKINQNIESFCRIEVDELRKNDLTTEKLNLEMELKNIQFENKSTVKKEQFLNLSSECNTMTSFTKTNLNNVAQKLKECLNDLEVVNIQATADQG